MKTLLALLLTSSILFAQIDTIHEFKLPELRITQLENGKLETYGFEDAGTMFLIKDSLLEADPVKYKYKVLISDIKKIEIKDGNSTLQWAKTSALIGGGGSLVLAGMIASMYGGQSDKTTLIFTIPAFVLSGVLTGAIIGGILGSIVPHYEEYKKFPEDLQAKKEILKQIFKKHNSK